MVEQKTHEFSLKNREDFRLKGVIKVETFDDCEVVLETTAGPLAVRGDNLHINQLNLETGELSVVGLIKSIQYMEAQGLKGVKGKGKSIIDRILK